jgi:hypothetical protein
MFRQLAKRRQNCSPDGPKPFRNLHIACHGAIRQSLIDGKLNRFENLAKRG